MVFAGVCFIVAAVGVLIAFLTGGVLWTLVPVVALIVAGAANVRPPTVLTLDDAGYRARGRRGTGTWKSVESVEVDDGLLRFTDGAGEITAIPLQLVDHRQRADLIRDVYDRLNTAHGYRRFDPSEWQ